MPVGLSGSDGFRGLLDPAGLLKKDDEAGFRDLRAAEIKHDRVALMAELGGDAQSISDMLYGFGCKCLRCLNSLLCSVL